MFLSRIVLLTTRVLRFANSNFLLGQSLVVAVSGDEDPDGEVEVTEEIVDEEAGAEDEEQHDRIRNFRANTQEPIPWNANNNT